MERLKVWWEELTERVRKSVRDAGERRILLFGLLNVILALVAFVMTVLNIITAEWVLMVATLTFSLLCAANAILVSFLDRGRRILYRLFAVEALLLLGFFIVSGIPQGFSILWMALIPSFALLVFGLRTGALFSALAFSQLLLFFWTPWGRSLLRYDYGPVFMLRFPFFYLACFLLAFIIEAIRVETERQLVASERRYRHLSLHDALTDIFNRYGFNAAMDASFARPGPRPVAFMILDIDDFKEVNDTYGHAAGDLVLQMVAEQMRAVTCAKSVCCRWGGEEFALFMDCGHDPREVAEQLRKSVESAVVDYRGSQIRITVSIGVCCASDMQTVTIAQLVTLADKYLYEAKGQGKNQVSCLEFGA